VGEVRALVGPSVPIACTFDLHGNIPARLAQWGDILVGLKTAPHTDSTQTAELASRILLDTLAGKVHPVSYVLPIPMILQGEKAMTTALVAGINDAPAVGRCFDAGAGKTLTLSIGATIEKRFGPPLEVEAQVVRLVANPRLAVIRIGDVEAILANGPVAFIDPGQFTPCGIEPLSRKIVIVKEGYLYPGLTRIAPRYIMLLTPGAGDMRLERLTYLRRRRPIFPFEPDTSFDPGSPSRAG
jgi:microcystin degradation protein MlrC